MVSKYKYGYDSYFWPRIGEEEYSGGHVFRSIFDHLAQTARNTRRPNGTIPDPLRDSSHFVGGWLLIPSCW